MKLELTFTNSSADGIWDDFGYRTEEFNAKTAVFGLKMLERAQRGEVTTKTQAFIKTLEEDGEALGIKLDTPTDYFALGAMFAANLAAQRGWQSRMAHRGLRVAAKVAMLGSAGVAGYLFFARDPFWIVACAGWLAHPSRQGGTRWSKGSEDRAG
jgi:hypothetical protein